MGFVMYSSQVSVGGWVNSSYRGGHSITSGLQCTLARRLHLSGISGCFGGVPSGNRHFSSRLAAAAAVGEMVGGLAGDMMSDLGVGVPAALTYGFIGCRSTQSSSSANTRAGASARSGLCILIGDVGLVTSSSRFGGIGSQSVSLSLLFGDGARRSTTG